jgi:hypothetical protein
MPEAIIISAGVIERSIAYHPHCHCERSVAMTVGELANDLKLLKEYKRDKMYQVEMILSLVK